MEFDYTKYKDSKISVEKLDQMMAFVLDSGTGTIGAIIAGIKVLFVSAYLIARKSLIDHEREVAKQEYEKERTQGNRTNIGNDVLD